MRKVPQDIIEQFGNPVRVFDPDPINDPSHTEAVFKCPFCEEVMGKPDRSGHLFVNVKSRYYRCVRCCTEGRLKIGNSMYKQSKDHSTEDIVELAKGVLSESKKSSSIQYAIPYSKLSESDTGTQYMIDRGFSHEMIEFYDMRVGSVFKKKEFGRVIIPNVVYDEVFTDMYVARTYIDDPKRYMNPPGKNSSVTVFNLHRIPDNPDRIIICEGVLTAIAAGMDAIALFGKSCSKQQMTMILSKHPKEIVVNLDPDAVIFSEQLCDRLSMMTDATIKNLVLPDKFDAADYLKLGLHDEYRELVEEAPKYDKFINKLKKAIN